MDLLLESDVSGRPSDDVGSPSGKVSEQEVSIIEPCDEGIGGYSEEVVGEEIPEIGAQIELGLFQIEGGDGTSNSDTPQHPTIQIQEVNPMTLNVPHPQNIVLESGLIGQPLLLQSVENLAFIQSAEPSTALVLPALEQHTAQPWILNAFVTSNSTASQLDNTTNNEPLQTEAEVQEHSDIILLEHPQINLNNSSNAQAETVQLYYMNEDLNYTAIAPHDDSREDGTPTSHTHNLQDLLNQTFVHGGVPPSVPTVIVHKELSMCYPCGAVYETKQELDEHLCKINYKVGKKQFSCGICPSIKSIIFDNLVSNSLTIDKGATEEDEGKSVDATPCEEATLTPQGPSAQAPKEEAFGCRGFNCKESFALETLRGIHERASHPHLFIHVCEECDKRYCEEGHLETHLKTHDNTEDKASLDAKLQCESQGCKMEFGEKETLAEHLLSHTGEGKLECEDCHRKFLSLQKLSSHLAIDHKIEKPYKCSVCDQKFSFNFQRVFCVKEHKGRGEGLHFNDDSGMGEREREGNVESHVSTEGDDGDNKAPDNTLPMKGCHICGKLYNPKSLRYHLMSHTGVKNFKCSICDKRFYAKYQLKLHLRTHTREKPYVCSICHFAFALNGSLTKHMKVHDKF